MISGHVSHDGVPQVYLPLGGRNWLATVDTGFNGALELPNDLRDVLPHSYAGEVISALAAGQVVVEDSFAVEFPFDGETVRVLVTFAPVTEILLGTRLLRDHRLEIDFVSREVTLERIR